MIEIDASDLQKAAELLQGMPGAAQKAAKTAIKKSIRGAKKDATQKAKERYTIKPTYITRTMKFSFAALGATLTSRGRVNDLAYFKHKPTAVPKRRPPAGQYLYSQVVKGQGGTIAHAFLAKMKSGHVGVFRRTAGNSSLPIEKLSGPSTPQMLESPSVREYVETRAQERLSKELDHEVNAFLMGYRR